MKFKNIVLFGFIAVFALVLMLNITGNTALPSRVGQTLQCKQELIQGYPTWEFSDGSRQSGELTISQLSQKTGCEV